VRETRTAFIDVNLTHTMGWAAAHQSGCTACGILETKKDRQRRSSLATHVISPAVFNMKSDAVPSGFSCHQYPNLGLRLGTGMIGSNDSYE
jgi:hypothetical protein